MSATVKYTPKKTNHILHGILTLFTGVWALVWITAAICNNGTYQREESFTN